MSLSSSRKTSQKKTLAKTPSRYSNSVKKSTPGEEMKSIMSDWHKPVYHKSSFSMSTDMVANICDSRVEESNRTMCRICQSVEDSMKNQQVTPCGCAGSLQYVHIDCLRQWRLTQKAKGFDVSHCELCKKPYNVQLLGDTDVPVDNLLKLQEDLKQLVRSGIYLMLLVKSWKKDLADLHLEQTQKTSRNESTPNFFNSTANLNRSEPARLQEKGGSYRSLQTCGTSNTSHCSGVKRKEKAPHLRSTVVLPAVATCVSESFSDSSSSGDDDTIFTTREALKRYSNKAALHRSKKKELLRNNSSSSSRN